LNRACDTIDWTTCNTMLRADQMKKDPHYTSQQCEAIQNHYMYLIDRQMQYAIYNKQEDEYITFIIPEATTTLGFGYYNKTEVLKNIMRNLKKRGFDVKYISSPPQFLISWQTPTKTKPTRSKRTTPPPPMSSKQQKLNENIQKMKKVLKHK